MMKSKLILGFLVVLILSACGSAADLQNSGSGEEQEIVVYKSPT